MARASDESDRMPSAVEGTELLVRKDTVIWRGLGSSDRGPARVQW